MDLTREMSISDSAEPGGTTTVGPPRDHADVDPDVPGVNGVAETGVTTQDQAGEAGRPPFRPWVTARAALVIFVLVPGVLTVVGSVVVLDQRYQRIVLRAVFLVVACLLPAMMWYLFTATRKASLFNEFLAGLDRLGLLRQEDGEEPATRKRRVSSADRSRVADHASSRCRCCSAGTC